MKSRNMMLALLQAVVMIGLLMSSSGRVSAQAAGNLDKLDAAAFKALVIEKIGGVFGTKAPEDCLVNDVVLAVEAFLWAFPLVNTAPNFVKNGFTDQSDMNNFIWQYVPNNASFNSIVTPNVNVLYGPGFFDLTKGPINITVPNTSGRYYVLQCMDFWGFTFTRIGFTVTGTEAGTYTLVGPDYKGVLGPNTFQSPTNGVWIMGRLAVINQNSTDIAIGDALLEQFVVSAPSNPDSVIFDTTTKASKLWSSFVKKGRQSLFWQAYTTMVKYNPPLSSMTKDLAMFKSLGVTARGVNWNRLTAVQKLHLNMGTRIGWKLLQESTSIGVQQNSSSQTITLTGWVTSPAIGSTNASIPITAIVSYAYVAANIPAEAVYWNKLTDNCKQGFKIGSNYVFTLATKPPYNAFWSLTIYNTTDFFLVPTTNNTYTLGSQFPNLVYNAEGGATLYMSQAPPSDPAKMSNWLPLGLPSTSKSDSFYFIFRIYSPVDADVVNTYSPPAIELADADYNPVSCPAA